VEKEIMAKSFEEIEKTIAQLDGISGIFQTHELHAWRDMLLSDIKEICEENRRLNAENRKLKGVK